MNPARRSPGGGAPKREASRLAADDWVSAALAAIGTSGVSSVTVEGIARTLGVTKGSFYWHFENQAQLLAAALARWEARDTEEVIAMLRSEPDPRARLEILFRGIHTERSQPSVHVALSSATDHPLVRPCLERISARRLGYVEACLAELGLPRSEARCRAMLAYAAYVGFLHLQREEGSRGLPGTKLHPRWSGRSLARYRAHVITTLVPKTAGSRQRDGLAPRE